MSLNPSGKTEYLETSPGPSPAVRSRAVWICPVTCCVALLTCIFVAQPFADAGFNDDWSYAHVAMKLAETGRLHYNGWGSPTILFQVLWGALWIRLFGFSFDVLRAATIPFSAGYVLLVYALGRRVGLTRNFATFGAITAGTSPLFLPEAASFMTEAYSGFFIVLCVYAAVSSAEAAGRKAAVRWLWILAVSGIAGGSDRQIVWVAPVAFIPFLAWLKRSDHRFLIHAIGAYSVCIACLGFLATRLAQPYGPLELSHQQILARVLHGAVPAFFLIVRLNLSCLLIALPAFLCFVPVWKMLGMARSVPAGLVCLAVVVFFAHRFGDRYLAPFLGNMLSPTGLFDNDALGSRPTILPFAARASLTWLLFFSVLAFVHFCILRCARLPRMPVTLFVLFSGGYLALVVPGALLGPGFVFDRYALPLFPMVVLFILLSAQTYVSRAPLAAWICLAVFALYAVGTTHDYFRGLRARVQAAQELERRGISRQRISAGFEYDGWTQLQLAGTIKPVLYGDAPRTFFWFWPKATALDPEYAVSYWAPSDLPPERRTTVFYRTWLPPFQWAAVSLSRADLPKFFKPLPGPNRQVPGG